MDEVILNRFFSPILRRWNGAPTTDARPNPFADLAKKLEILEREMAVQQVALARLKALGEAPRVEATGGRDSSV